MTVNVPAPETEGSNEDPTTPVPEKTPPLGLPDKGTAALFVHNDPIAASDTVGAEFTFTVAVWEAEVEHPVKLPVTVYTVVPVGLTLIFEAFEPVFHV